MSENLNPSASEENPTAADAAAAGGSADGGAGGAQAGADAFAAERESLAKQARDFQSRADREQARAEAAERRLAELSKPAGTPAASEAPAGLTMADLIRYDQLKDAKTELAAKYPDANPDILARAVQFDSPEAFEASVERSHNANKAMRERIEREAEERMRALLEERGIKLDPNPAPPTGTTPPVGDPTPADLNRMTPEEWEELEAKSPGVIDRVLAANSGGELLRTTAFED